MMGIVVPETCWAYKKYNKIISVIQVTVNALTRSLKLGHTLKKNSACYKNCHEYMIHINGTPNKQQLHDTENRNHKYPETSMI